MMNRRKKEWNNDKIRNKNRTKKNVKSNNNNKWMYDDTEMIKMV